MTIKNLGETPGSLNRHDGTVIHVVVNLLFGHTNHFSETNLTYFSSAEE